MRLRPRRSRARTAGTKDNSRAAGVAPGATPPSPSAKPRSKPARRAAPASARATELAGSRFQKAGESPGFLLWQVSAIWQRSVRHALETIGLTHVQFVLLAGVGWLTAQGHPVTQVELSRQTKTDVMTTSQVLSSLEARGLVVRTEHPDDSRAKSLRLSPGSHELLARAVRLVEVVDAKFFAPLDDQLSSFVSAMKRLVNIPTSGE